MMLRRLGAMHEAARIALAVERTLAAGCRTGDFGDPADAMLAGAAPRAPSCASAPSRCRSCRATVPGSRSPQGQ
jgi:hypothetical protein